MGSFNISFSIVVEILAKSSSDKFKFKYEFKQEINDTRNAELDPKPVEPGTSAVKVSSILSFTSKNRSVSLTKLCSILSIEETSSNLEYLIRKFLSKR
jgi:hypothetical protein